MEYEESLGLNLYEMDVRSYDPAIGRFTSIDPIVHHSMSTYTAFDNNPVYWADPSGADSQTYSSSEDIQSLLNWAKTANDDDSNGCDDCSKCPETCNENQEGESGRRRGRQRARNRGRTGSGSLFFDARGQELLSHWLDGSGKNLDLSSENWQEYMKENELLADDVNVEIAIYMERWGKFFKDGEKHDFSLKFHGEIQNGYSTGYEMLHGSVSSLGDVQIKGTMSYNQANKSFDLSYEVVWNDRIDPNPKYRGDKIYSKALNWFYTPKDYNVKIRYKNTSTYKPKSDNP